MSDDINAHILRVYIMYKSLTLHNSTTYEHFSDKNIVIYILEYTVRKETKL